MGDLTRYLVAQSESRLLQRDLLVQDPQPIPRFDQAPPVSASFKPCSRRPPEEGLVFSKPFTGCQTEMGTRGEVRWDSTNTAVNNSVYSLGHRRYRRAPPMITPELRVPSDISVSQ